MRAIDVAGFMVGALCAGAILGTIVELAMWAAKRIWRLIWR